MSVKDNSMLKRPPGSYDIHSRHYITLGEVIKGTTVAVKTVKEITQLTIKPDSLFQLAADDGSF